MGGRRHGRPDGDRVMWRAELREVGWVRRTLAAIAVLLATATCSSKDSEPAEHNACVTLCNKMKSCGEPVAPVCSPCPYGGLLIPGLGPSPSCADLEAHTSCIEAAARQSCSDYGRAAAACPRCGVLDGSPCSVDADCATYLPGYRCDRSRPGGYCTRRCDYADSDCSAIGPEVCVGGPAPSFDPGPGPEQKWCFLGCKSDGDCRVSEGYACVFGRVAGVPRIGICDKP